VIFGPAEKFVGAFAGENHVGTGVPAAEPRRAERIVAEEEIDDGVFLAAAGAKLVRIGPGADALFVRGLASAPFGLGKNRERKTEGSRVRSEQRERDYCRTEGI
jgi:hypothetical protein